jgi:hypothetical protein
VLSTNDKGNVAEAAVTYEATKLGIDVYRPVGEGGRYDLIFDLGDGFVRVQCKWAPLHRGAVIVRCYSSRRNCDGSVRRVYAPGEVDAFAAYCHDLGRCFFLPYDLFVARTQVQLRVRDSRNNQKSGINWASDFDFAAKLSAVQGAIAQLGERRHGMAEVAGSIPAGSTVIRPCA